MKRLLITVAAVLLFACQCNAAAFQGSESSGEKTSDTLIYTGESHLAAILVITNGTNDATAVLYDNTVASGKKIFEAVVSGASNFGGRNFVFPVRSRTGLYLDLTGTGASAIVEYLNK